MNSLLVFSSCYVDEVHDSFEASFKMHVILILILAKLITRSITKIWDNGHPRHSNKYRPMRKICVKFDVRQENSSECSTNSKVNSKLNSMLQ